MLDEKAQVISKLQEKGVDVEEAAKAIEFDPQILKLYLSEDDYPIPGRILKKLEEAVLN
ncbi:hypothetical protein SAMN02746041_02910 [Desulfacinum hydrothermale DSM 13146]|uniref:Helix-turn-helix domain-containing protein n=1 Tax=Desulfacinum hydrothermale DSM 13146 TaxID=1121390 RepID=A0A1W1XTC7_9BACT|nr:hypothetical protein [Desulfacinum hydrothermale]SMC27230.1 hypothetical protein SAMN02746041_02910 [Desulfacinum hydrothermale DSM 13146]